MNKTSDNPSVDAIEYVMHRTYKSVYKKSKTDGKGKKERTKWSQ